MNLLNMSKLMVDPSVYLLILSQIVFNTNMVLVGKEILSAKKSPTSYNSLNENLIKVLRDLSRFTALPQFAFSIR